MKKLIAILTALGLICSQAQSASIITRGANSAYAYGFMKNKPGGAPVLQYVNNGGIGCTSSSSYTPGMPSSVSIGDLLILQVEVGLSSAIVPTPSGWTAILNQYNAAKTNSFAVFYQVYAGGGAPSVTGGTYIAATISRYTGANTTTPIGAVGTYSSGSTTTVTTTALTTTANNSLVGLAFVAPNITGAAYTTPSTWTSAFDLWSATCNSEQAVVTKSVATSGTSSGSTSSTDSNIYTLAGFAWFAIQFEILHR